MVFGGDLVGDSCAGVVLLGPGVRCWGIWVMSGLVGEGGGGGGGLIIGLCVVCDSWGETWSLSTVHQGTPLSVSWSSCKWTLTCFLVFSSFLCIRGFSIFVGLLSISHSLSSLGWLVPSPYSY